jgi:hypothetical protein
VESSVERPSQIICWLRLKFQRAADESGSRAVRNKLCCYLFGLISRANQRKEASRRRQPPAERASGWAAELRSSLVTSRYFASWHCWQACRSRQNFSLSLSAKLFWNTRPSFVTPWSVGAPRRKPCAVRVEQGELYFGWWLGARHSESWRHALFVNRKELVLLLLFTSPCWWMMTKIS